jgi:hypothetical protein
MIPEYIVDDVASIMIIVQQVTVLYDQMQNDNVILACTALMGSPAHVRNPYLRYQLCSVLHQWIPSRRCDGASLAGMLSLFCSGFGHLNSAGRGIDLDWACPAVSALHI